MIVKKGNRKEVRKPLQLYAGDFDGNSTSVLSRITFIKDNAGKFELFPGLDRNQLADQLPSVKKKFLLHGDHAKATMKDLLNTISAKDMVEKTCETTASVWIEIGAMEILFRMFCLSGPSNPMVFY